MRATPLKVVIHHSADDDGQFSGAIARHFLGGEESTIYAPWDYGDPIPPAVMDADVIYMIDVRVASVLYDRALLPKVILIDHHKSTIDEFSPFRDMFLGWYCIDGVAACRLAWQWFTKMNQDNFPVLEDFAEGRVTEPEIVRLAGLWDVWDHRDPKTSLFHYGWLSMDDAEKRASWAMSFSGYDQGLATMTLENILRRGEIAMAAIRHNEGYAATNAHTVQWEGINWLVMNSANRGSQQFQSKVDTSIHQGLLRWCFNGTQVEVSLYSIGEWEDGQPDFSRIALKYGGGGHRGACGFKSGLTWPTIFYSDDNRRVDFIA